jgi:hypothetical protein
MSFLPSTSLPSHRAIWSEWASFSLEIVHLNIYDSFLLLQCQNCVQLCNAGILVTRSDDT